MRVDVVEIPRHSDIGLVTNLAVGGTTLEGTAIELPAGDQALARFEELTAT